MVEEPSIRFGAEARQELADGLDALADVVRVTLGPRGRHVLLERGSSSPIITKDGVTVAREIELSNHFANMGAQMVKEVASQTADEAGDGTTTATVLAQSIYHEGAKLVAAGIDPMEIRRGIDAAISVIVNDLARQSRSVDGRADIARVGSVSANGDIEIGNLIADAMEHVGSGGVVTIEEARTMETRLEFEEGMSFDSGYLSPYFINNEARLEAILDDVAILVCESKITDLRVLFGLLQEAVEANQALLIIAPDLANETLATLVINRLRGGLSVCAVQAPGFGDGRIEVLDDIAVVVGTRTFSSNRGDKLDEVKLTQLGSARRAVITRNSTTIIGGEGAASDIAGRVALLEAQLESADARATHDLERRLAKLGRGIAVIHVGAPTQTELSERMVRFDDALRATRAATEEGVVPGGGVALLRASERLATMKCRGEQQYGVELIRRALEAPLRQMAANAGVDGSLVVHEVRQRQGAFGYNVEAERYEDLVAAGIIDPTKVVRVALQSAVSIASLLLTSEVAICETD